jgi:small subunit ribosomal protein S6
MAFYETTFIVRQDVSANELDNIVSAVESAVQGAQGTVARKEKWGLLALAYPIKKNVKGHYVHLAVEGGEGIPAALEKEYRRNIDTVIRHLTVVTDALPTEESHMMRQDKRAGANS